MYGPHLTTNLRMARLRSGLPQFLVAKRAKLAASRLSVLERGYDGPNGSERSALARVLGVPEEQLFPAEPSHAAPTPAAAPSASN